MAGHKVGDVVNIDCRVPYSVKIVKIEALKD
jgi:transcription elongation GreA/GreB family factor